MNRVLVTGGAGTIGQAVVRRLLRDPAFEVKVSDQRAAPDWMREGCEVHRATCGSSPRRATAMSGCTHVIHLAAIVGGIANFHKLPHTLTEVNNALYNAVFRAALDADVQRFTYVSSSMVFEQAEEYPTPEDHLPRLPDADLAPTASPSSPARSTAAPRTTSTACRSRSAARSTRTGPGEMPDDEPGIAHAVPDLHPQVAAAPAAAADLRLRRADADAHPRRRHRRRHRHRDGHARRASTRTSTSRPPTSAPSPRSRASAGRRAARPARSSSSSTCRPSRSTSSAAGRASRRPSGCSAGRRRSASRTASRRPPTGCATRRGSRA